LGAGVAPDGGIDGARERVEAALDDGVVDLVDVAVVEGTFELAVGHLALGDDHDAARARVEAVHDPLALCRAGGAYHDAGVGESAEYGGAVPAGGGVGSNAEGLVEDD